MIIINGKKHEHHPKIMSYTEIIELAGYSSSNQWVSVTYGKGHENFREGIMHFGKVVPIKEGMIFSAMMTNNA